MTCLLPYPQQLKVGRLFINNLPTPTGASGTGDGGASGTGDGGASGAGDRSTAEESVVAWPERVILPENPFV